MTGRATPAREVLDLSLGQGGLLWAYWITLFWGLGLGFHAPTYVEQGRRLVEGKTQQYLGAGKRAP
jgi:hypothetical protein